MNVTTTVTTTDHDVWRTYRAIAESMRKGASTDCVRVDRDRDGTINRITHYGIGLHVRRA